jgi:diaminohydroxyphosphoribosylaminopyrimidine deaminase/5-amino-6-(5-phosphoribosylamino)uracil reductase
MNTDSRDFELMTAALRLARRGLYSTDPNPRVGCVIVREQKIVGEGWHERAGGEHAEIMALNAAGDLSVGATAYVTLEPCAHHGRTPPCTDALIGAGIVRLVAATTDPNPLVAGEGLRSLEAAGLQVDSGVLEEAARALNRGFFQRMESGKPWVRSKIAISLDGRTALANGNSQWITGEPARRDVHRLRARSSAILTGVGTVVADDPSLNVRFDDETSPRQPLRVVADSRLALPPAAKMLGLPGPIRVFCIEAPADVKAALEAKGVVVEAIGSSDGKVSLPDIIRRLGELEANEVLVEAGARLNGALLQAGLLDELVVYMSAVVLGSDSRGMFDIPALTEMADRKTLSLAEVRRVGADVRLTYRIETQVD